MRRKFTFNSTISDWLIHRDSSSVEYNAGSPTKLRLRNLAALCFVFDHTNPDGSSLLRERLDFFSVFTGLRASLPRGIVEKENREK